MFANVRVVLAVCALLSLLGTAISGTDSTLVEFIQEGRFIVANQHMTYDQKMLTRLGDLYSLMLFVNHATPEDAVVGFPPLGQYGNFPMLWHYSFAYPRRLREVGTYEDFLRQRPTHMFLYKDFPPYAFPGDPRPDSELKSFERPAIVMVQGVRP